MKAAELRQAILQAAVQGKLVPQNAYDEPASELLERIRQEKVRLIKEGKIKKEKPLPPIAEDDILYDLPDGWVWYRLGNICLKLTDGAHSTPKYVENGVPFLSVKDVSTGKINFSNSKHITQEEHDELYKRCNPEKGDILLTKVGTTGIPVIVDTEKPFSLFVSVALLKISQSNSNLEFIRYLLQSPLVYQQSQENTRGVGNKNWVLTAIANTVVAIPPLAEQQRIVTKVDELMALCDELEAAEKELDALENRFSEYLPKSILQAAVQGKLVSQNIHDELASELLERIRQEKARLVQEGKLKKEKPLPPIADDEIPYDLPDGWVWCRLSEVCIVNPRNQLSDDVEVAFTPMPLISSEYFGGHGQETKKWGDVKSGFTHYAENDVVVAKITPCFQNGKSCVMKKLKNGFGAGTTELHVLRCIEIIPEYLLVYVKNPSFLIDGEMNMTGTAGQQRVPTDYLKSCLFPVPPLAEQQRIVAKVDELMALCDELKAAKDISVKRVASNIVPFPQQGEDEREIGIAARGEMQEISAEAAHDIREMFGDDSNA